MIMYLNLVAGMHVGEETVLFDGSNMDFIFFLNYTLFQNCNGMYYKYVVTLFQEFFMYLTFF